MSEENNNNQTQPLDAEPLPNQHKTSSVPLRKETVRVTLKSTPAGAKPAPSAPRAPMPTSMTPNTAPHATKAPSAHNPDIPDVTSAVPLKEETMRVTLKADNGSSAPAPSPKGAPVAPKMPAPAPTIPLSGAAGAPRIAAPAPTIPLNVGSSASIPLATQPLRSSSQPLPKATVQLQQTQQLARPGVSPAGGQAATIHTVVDEDSSAERSGNGETILAVAAFLLSLFLLFSQFQRAGIWVDEHENGSYGAVFSSMD